MIIAYTYLLIVNRRLDKYWDRERIFKTFQSNNKFSNKMGLNMSSKNNNILLFILKFPIQKY